MIDKPLALVLILVVAVVAATACGASGRLDGGPGPLPDRAGALSNEQGNQDFSNESYEDALEAYQRAGRELPDRPEPHYNAGNTWYRQQNFEEAWGQYLKAMVNADPELAQRSAFNIGNALYSATQFTEAIESYQEALRLDPDDVDAKHNLELALLQREQQSEEESEDPGARPGQQPQDPQQEAEDQESQDEQDDQGQPQGPSQSDEAQGAQASDESQPGPAAELTEDQARQLLEALGDNTETLQSRLRRDLGVPGEPPARDW